VVGAPEAGVLLPERSAAAIADAVGELTARNVLREDTRRYAERFGWAATTAGQLELFARVLSAPSVSAQATLSHR
jgi:teichuronic acid biosynthesis glycosyltransferase TuaC